MLIDSHCHLNILDLDADNGDLGALIERAKNVGVDHILCVGINIENAQAVIDVAQQFKQVSASVGLHPSETVETEPTVMELVKWADHPKVVAIGETGLDFYYNKTGLDNMRERFRVHIRAALKSKKPLIIHTRDARQDTINIMREENASQVGGVMHCFTESWQMAQEAMELGFYISFSGIVTFKNAKNVVEVAQQVPMDKMLIETDAPYLTPDPYRGKPNEPQYVRFVAERIAKIKGISYEEVVEQTGQNFSQLFAAR